MDNRVQRHGPRAQLWESLDKALRRKYSMVKDAVEGKLFGIGSENYVVGSHGFYRDYSLARNILWCLDTGHFTNIPLDELPDMLDEALVPADRPGVLTHISFPERWDSDFVARTMDYIKSSTDAARRSGRGQDVYYGNDFFQPGAQPIAQLVIGGRTTRKAILWSHLDPYDLLVEAENAGADDIGGPPGSDMVKLAIDERRGELNFGAVWDKYCLEHDVPVGLSYLGEIRNYEKRVMAGRD